MLKTVVINVVGLTKKLLGKHTPLINEWVKKGKIVSIKPVLPAVTCTAQATYLTGKFPSEHGIVGNGWYFRDECEVKFWRQSNKLVQATKIWEKAQAQNSNFTCANLFWWYNMYSSVNYAVTPRPMYPADGRKIPDIYTQPGEIRNQLQSELGQFPLFKFWGPNTSIESSLWIAKAAKWIEAKYNPTLNLIYLPHLDYCLQRYGLDENLIAEDLQKIDTICGDLIQYFTDKQARIIILSEYGIVNVNQPIHINRILRKNNLLTVREELGKELLDSGDSKAFAVADHQIAHIYVNDLDCINQVRFLLEKIPGIAHILDQNTQKDYHLNHSRSGELIAIADANSWFTYYYWLDDKNAPDFARTVDIHRKPGYDPVELFINPNLAFPKLKIGLTLLKKQLGFRYLLDVIPLDAELVRGSHGCLTSTDLSPVFITEQKDILGEKTMIESTDVYSLIWEHLFINYPKCS